MVLLLKVVIQILVLAVLAEVSVGLPFNFGRIALPIIFNLPLK
jgi:hypothetical protein